MSRTTARCRRPSSLASDDARFPRRAPAAQQGLRYPADPPTVEEIVAVMRAAGDTARPPPAGLIVVLWRAGLRIGEALALAESDLDGRRGSVLVRRGKGGRRREVGMDDWAWQQLQPWLERASSCPSGRCFASSAARRADDGGLPPRPQASCATPRRAAGVRRRFAPHQLRHAHAVEMAREGVPLIVIQRSSATATSASPRSTSKASTTPRSSTPSTPDALR